MDSFLASLGGEITDVEEEAFLLFSQTIPSNSLGFVNSKSDDLIVTVGHKEYEIHQSPSLLHSNRSAGTTGAVLWQVTPRFARWMTDPSNFFHTKGLLNKQSVILELGCGVSGVLCLSLAPKVKSYIVTDQNYVLKTLRQNIAANKPAQSRPGVSKKRQLRSTEKSSEEYSNIIVKSLDWETDDIKSLFSELDPSLNEERIDFVLACDCIYNEALVDPFVDVCAELCGLETRSHHRTLCVVAQQLRSSDVFEMWLKTFNNRFSVWRIPHDSISSELGEDSGFVVHVGLLR